MAQRTAQEKQSRYPTSLRARQYPIEFRISLGRACLVIKRMRRAASRAISSLMAAAVFPNGTYRQPLKYRCSPSRIG